MGEMQFLAVSLMTRRLTPCPCAHAGPWRKGPEGSLNPPGHPAPLLAPRKMAGLISCLSEMTPLPSSLLLLRTQFTSVVEDCQFGTCC